MSINPVTIQQKNVSNEYLPVSSDNPLSVAIGGSTGGSVNTTNLNPTPTYFGVLLQEDIVNILVATPAVRYLDVEGMGEVVIHYDVVNAPGSGGALTMAVAASAENNGTADSSASYVDITQYGTDCETAAAAATFTADAILRVNVKGLKFLRITITATGDDTGDASLYVNRAY